ncbi:phytoene desaturase family protein [Mycobacterium seoulense]|uniref:phytoene desaturase family protein n=1 Tax=Mycobacterium seoulense TaxID=386911 RepID=UPI003CF107F8
MIIGGGHNGLIAANYLALRGRRTVVIEASKKLGGMTTSGNFFAEAPHHVMHPCAVDVIFMNTTTIPRDLELAKFGYRTVEPDLPYVYLHPDGSVVPLWRDSARTVHHIGALSPHDASAYRELADLLEKLRSIAVPAMNLSGFDPRNVAKAAMGALHGRRSLSDIVGFATASALQVVDERFTHPAVRSALLNLAASAGRIDKAGSSMSLLLLALIHDTGISRPLGGMATLTNALARGLTARGGQIFTGTAVEAVELDSGAVRGVNLEDGRFVSARAVLSTADPHTTLTSLLPRDALDLATTARVNHIPANGDGVSPFKVDVALSGRLTVPGHHLPSADLRVPVQMLGTVDEILDSFAAARRGQIPVNPAMWVCIPTAADPSQAPSGEDSAYLYPLAMPLEPPTGWTEVSSIAEKATLAMASRYIGGFEDLEKARLVETPPMLAERTRARNGCLTHVDFDLVRTGPLRPAWGLGGYTTPVAGLFLGGAGSHPGGGVSGLPGKFSARRVDKFLNKRT